MGAVAGGRPSNLTLVGAGEPLLRLEKRLACTACGELTARAYVRW